MSDLRDALRNAPLPDEGGARERGWRVVRAAYAGREPVRPRRGPRIAVAAAVAACAAIAVVAVTPPGAAVGEWLRDVVTPAPERVAPPSLTSLPTGGRLLVLSDRGPWILQRDGSRRRLGDYDQATFSPRGLYLAVTRGGRLSAVDPRGRVRWSLAHGAAVRDPAWSPGAGFRVAYRAGSDVRVVYGDGQLDRRVAARVAPVGPAWRPGTRRQLLAWVDARGRVVLADTDRGRVLWRARTPSPPLELAWAPGGRRLLVRSASTVHMLRAGDGAAAGTTRLPAGSRARAVAWPPDGGTPAIARQTGTRSEVTVGTRRVFAGPGRVTDVAYSPDGRWLLIARADADQWLFVRTGTGRIAAVSRVAREFDPGGRGPAPFPRVAGWCCAPYQP